MSNELTHRRTRIISVVAATAIALSCGTNYAFSAWEPQFAERLDLTATEANLIGGAGNIGMYAVGIPGGILIDSKGPRWGVLVGVLGLACGYFPMYSAYKSGPGSMSLPLLCLAFFFTGIASGTAFSAALKVSATNWPHHRGTATAFPLSAFGLSAFFWTTLSGILFPDDTSAYLLLLAVGTTGLVFVSMFFLQIIVPVAQYEALAVTSESPIPRNNSYGMQGTSLRSRSASLQRASGNTLETSSLMSSDGSLPGDIEESKPEDHARPHRPDITGWTLIRTPTFWTLWIMLGLLCGVGLMTINNIGNNVRSLWRHYDPNAPAILIQERQLMHVGILSLGSFVGRLSSGIGSDWLIHHNSSRFWTLVTSACIFSAAQCIGLSLTNPNLLFLLSGLTGIAYGILFGVYPALVVDAFGPSGMGINWGAMTIAPVISGSFFNLAYGSILDSHSFTRGEERICDEGRNCYASAYWVTLAASVAGIAWSFACAQRDQARRRREAQPGVLATLNSHEA